MNDEMSGRARAFGEFWDPILVKARAYGARSRRWRRAKIVGVAVAAFLVGRAWQWAKLDGV